MQPMPPRGLVDASQAIPHSFFFAIFRLREFSRTFDSIYFDVSQKESPIRLEQNAYRMAAREEFEPGTIGDAQRTFETISVEARGLQAASPARFPFPDSRFLGKIVRRFGNGARRNPRGCRKAEPGENGSRKRPVLERKIIHFANEALFSLLFCVICGANRRF